jgi:hypothetical protein
MSEHMVEEEAPTVVKVPLRARTGEVRAYALVDAEMAVEALAYRWCLLGAGYACRKSPRFAGKQGIIILLHRQLLEVLGDTSVHVDHINGDKLDNRLRNLRTVPIGANAQNKNFCTAGTSRFRGVYWYRRTGAWQAQAKLDGKCHYLGRFQSELAAAEVAEAFRQEHMPFAQPDPELLRHYEERNAVR